MVCAYDCPADGLTGWSKRPGSLGPNKSSKGRVAIVVQAATRATTATEDTIRRMRTTHGWLQWAALYPAVMQTLTARALHRCARRRRDADPCRSAGDATPPASR